MEPTFFGHSKTPLYGVYHPPLLNKVGGSAVLLCYPVFQEYIRSHRAFCQLASQLAKLGNHVFRFDYSSTGDSFGDTEDANYGQWLDDIVLAADELRELSGIRNISIVGLRFGATLACSSKLKQINKMVLWDPIINGRSYLRALANMNKAMLTDSDRFPSPRNEILSENFANIIGFRIPQTLISSINNAEISSLDVNNVVSISVVTSDDDDAINQLADELQKTHKSSNYKNIVTAGNWCELSKMDETLIPKEILEYICGLFTK